MAHKKYKKEINGSKFLIAKDFFGNWSTYCTDDDWEIVVGVPPFTVGHRTKQQAIDFLEGFFE